MDHTEEDYADAIINGIMQAEIEKAKPREAKQANMKNVEASAKADPDRVQWDGFEASMDYDDIKLKEPITLQNIEWSRSFKYRHGLYKNKPTRLLMPLGASAEDGDGIPEQKLKEMTDPYSPETRKDFSEIGTEDPIVAPSILFRVGAHFENGFNLKLKLASQINPQTGKQLTPEEVELALTKTEDIYRTALVRLSTWKNDKEIVNVVKDMEGVAIVQGKSASLIYPPIGDLEAGRLPSMVEVITAEDLGNPIIDAGASRQLVAVKLEMEDKKIARADEILYYTKGLRGLRREAKFHGVSPFEPIVQIAKAIKRYYNLDAPLAMISAYLTRQLIKVKNEGDPEELQDRIKVFMQGVFKASTWAVSMPEWYDGVDPITPKVDWAMFDGIENKLATVLLTVLGVPQSAMNRTQGITRDTATIEMIKFVRFVRNPAENASKEYLENQLFNPLLSHLVRVPMNEMPVRIEIERAEAEGGDLDVVFDSLSQDKNDDITSGNIVQNEAQTDPTKPVQVQTNRAPIGASGKKLRVTNAENRESYIVEEIDL
jgi:hypothetical protein